MQFKLPRLVWGSVADALHECDIEIARLRHAVRLLTKAANEAMREVRETRAELAQQAGDLPADAVDEMRRRGVL
jgi:Xaa-Pro aminopeptidase